MRLFFVGLLILVVLDYVLRHFDEALTDPEGLDYFEVRAERDQNAQKLLDVMELADVLVTRFLRDDEILEREDRELVGDLKRCGVGYLHLDEGVFCLHGRARNAIGELGQGVVVIACEDEGQGILLGIVISLVLEAIFNRRAELFSQIVDVALCLTVRDLEALGKAHCVGIIFIGYLFMQPLNSCVCGISRGGFHNGELIPFICII